MDHMRKIALSIILLATSSVALAQPKDAKKKADEPAPPPAAPKPTPAKELDALKPWLKTWKCTGANMAGEKVSAKLTFKRELDNFWASVKFEVAKTAKVPAFVGMGMFGIDPATKSWAMQGWDNMGGMIDMKTASASPTAITWEGTSVDMGRKAPAKFSMNLDDKKKLKFVGEIGGQKAFDYDCK
jgi:hypothetical protein